jgi:hypothetical protein
VFILLPATENTEKSESPQNNNVLKVVLQRGRAATQAWHGHLGRAHGQDARATVREIFAAQQRPTN